MPTEAPAADEFTVRRASPDDRDAIITLARASLGWKEGDPNEAFFTWKHDENAFGASPAWLSVAPDGRLAGLRVFLRWRFRTPEGQTLSAVRAVDTATHPDFQGRGIFTTLTLGALPDLRDDGVGNVFNTPNDKSRPGYLKMGWREIGRIPLGVLPARLPRRHRASSWTGSDKWGMPCDVGHDPEEAFSDHRACGDLLAAQPSGGLRTDRTVEFLRWRYGFRPLGYRVEFIGSGPEDGVVVFRLRRRGSRIDLTICEELLSVEQRRPNYLRLARRAGADWVVRTQHSALHSGPFVRRAGMGSVLTWLSLDGSPLPSVADLDFSYGDLELF